APRRPSPRPVVTQRVEPCRSYTPRLPAVTLMRCSVQGDDRVASGCSSALQTVKFPSSHSQGRRGIDGTTISCVASWRCAAGARGDRHRRGTGRDGGRGREGPGGLSRALVPVGVGQLLGAASGGGAGAARAGERLA